MSKPEARKVWIKSWNKENSEVNIKHVKVYINLPNLFLYLYINRNLSILYKKYNSQNQLSLYNSYVKPLLKNIFQKCKNLSYIERPIDI